LPEKRHNNTRHALDTLDMLNRDPHGYGVAWQTTTFNQLYRRRNSLLVHRLLLG
jgi:hypothetical protein